MSASSGVERETGGAFAKDVVEATTKLNPRPVIFHPSNPTDKAECAPEKAQLRRAPDNGTAIDHDTAKSASPFRATQRRKDGAEAPQQQHNSHIVQPAYAQPDNLL